MLDNGDDKLHQTVRVVSITDEFQNSIAPIIKLANMIYQIIMCYSLTRGRPTTSSIKHVGQGVEGHPRRMSADHNSQSPVEVHVIRT